MSAHDHQIRIGSDTDELTLIRDDDGRAMYQVSENIPRYRNPLEVIQTDWKGGHGQYDVKFPDVYFEGENIDTTQEGTVFLGPYPNMVIITGTVYLDSAPVKFLWCEFATARLLCATSGKIYYYDGTNWVAAATVVAGVTDLCFYNGVAYAARGGTPGSSYYYSTDGNTWTATDLAEDEMEGFLSAPNAAGTQNVLWGYKNNKLYFTTDGRTIGTTGVQWDSGASIGDTSEDITNAFMFNNNLLVGRTDNLYHYDADGGVHPLMEDLKHNRTTNNFKYVVDWQSGVYFSLGRGLGELWGLGQFKAMGPLTEIENIGKYGDCVGLASDKDFLFVVMDEGTNTHIYKVREARREGKLRWEYCPWIKLGTRTCATAYVAQHSAIDRRLWFGYTDGTNYSTAYVTLTDNPLATGSGAEFNTAGGFVRMSYDYGTNPYWDKLFQSIITETEDCSAAAPVVSVQPMYRKDTDATATNLTAAIVTNGVVKTNLTAELNCKRICFELHLASGASSATPQVRLFGARGIEKPETTRIHEAVYSIGDTPSERAKTIRTFLRGGRTSTSLIRFADLRYGDSVTGTFVYVVMEPDFPQEIEVKHTKGRQPELGIKVRLREISFA